jgi:hypothetical protein
MIRRFSVPFLAVWMAIFWAGSVIPAVREMHERLRDGARELMAPFSEYAAVRRSFQEISEDTGAGAIIVADGDAPDISHLVRRAEDAKYYLYPRRLFSFANGDASTVVNLVFFGSALRAEELPKTCRPSAAAYSCSVRKVVTSADGATPTARMEGRNLVVAVPTSVDRQNEPVAIVLSIGFALEELPVEQGFDLDLNVLVSARGSTELAMALPTPALAPYLRLRIVTLDSAGNLFAGPPRSVVQSVS